MTPDSSEASIASTDSIAFCPCGKKSNVMWRGSTRRRGRSTVNSLERKLDKKGIEKRFTNLKGAKTSFIVGSWTNARDRVPT
jgi:hypothetical protein